MWGCGPRIGSFLLFGEIRYNFAVEMISNEYLDDLNNVTIKSRLSVTENRRLLWLSLFLLSVKLVFTRKSECVEKFQGVGYIV